MTISSLYYIAKDDDSLLNEPSLFCGLNKFSGMPIWGNTINLLFSQECMVPRLYSEDGIYKVLVDLESKGCKVCAIPVEILPHRKEKA